MFIFFYVKSNHCVHMLQYTMIMADFYLFIFLSFYPGNVLRVTIGKHGLSCYTIDAAFPTMI
ncbi:hypothetical protein BCV71DRAFT_21929 [Rhizopus microsporus]|uniref:Uncharacterized protein n=1 Tax=Rhizopus microsporus TaxID=58291 RepID=A0A1X0RVV0_RHIZD|nr:hypothetical protein BCV71DRAFT_21929 [Rhizopus microsporus]